MITLSPRIVAMFTAGLLLTSTAQAKSNIELSGDVGAVMLPALAWGLSQLEGDKQGQTEFYWSLGSTLVTTELLKHTINERRPNGKDNNSFPSGHTSVSFQSATYVQQRYGWKTSLPFYAVASYVGWSRVHSDEHYTKDVLAGALLGIVNARYFTHPYHGVYIQPYGGAGGVGVNLHMKF